MANQQETTLQNLAASRLFVVPDYQRPYAWEQKQLADLWQDLDLLGDRTHYAGTIVVRQHAGRSLITKTGTALTVWDVVDGQQRLTTAFLLLDRLRRRLATLPHEDAPAMAQTLRATYGVVIVDGVQRPKIQLGSDLAEYWQHTILGEEPAGLPGLVAGQQRLRDAATFFDRRIVELTDGSPEDAYSRLVDLMRRLTDGLRFLVYEVSSEAEVGVIFETLNDRGRGLSELEKIKNYLLYLAAQIRDDRGQDAATFVNSRWSRIFQHLAEDARSEDQVLRAHWLATRNPDSRKWRRTASIKEVFLRSTYVPGASRLLPNAVAEAADEDDLWAALNRDIKNYVSELEQSALFISELHDPQAAFVDFTSGHERARAAGAALVRTRSVAVFYPLLIAARLRHPHDGDAYADLVTMCETYAARTFVLAERRSNTGEARINRIAKHLYDGRSIDHTKADLASLTWSVANDERVRGAMGFEYAWYPGTSHRYFLYEYERSLARSDDEVPDYAQFAHEPARTTEHILPRKPKDDAQWWNDFSPEEHEELVHALGNLVLTRDNSVYSNKDFVEKRGGHESPQDQRCYYRSHLAQERELAAYEAWTPDSIKARQQHLTEWALQRWPAARPETGDATALEADLGEDALDEESDETSETAMGGE